MIDIDPLYIDLHLRQDCIKTQASDGKELRVEVAYIRGSQVVFVILPDMLRKAPIFSRIKMWRKYKGHAVFGSGELIGKDGRSAVVRRPGPGGVMPSPGGGRGSYGAGSSAGGPPGRGSGVYGPSSSGPYRGAQSSGSYGGSGGGRY